MIPNGKGLPKYADDSTQGWQPIETAPKDGTRILIAFEDQQRAAYWDEEFGTVYDAETDEVTKIGAWTDGAVISFNYEQTHTYEPTHWMPLPASPSQTRCEAQMSQSHHKPGCPALGGYGHGVEACACGAVPPSATPSASLEQLLELIDACIGSVACDGSTAGACAATLKSQVSAALRQAPAGPQGTAARSAPAKDIDYITLSRAAQTQVRESTLYRRFIEGTPLENDIAVWMTEFAVQTVKDLIMSGQVLPPSAALSPAPSPRQAFELALGAGQSLRDLSPECVRGIRNHLPFDTPANGDLEVKE